MADKQDEAVAGALEAWKAWAESMRQLWASAAGTGVAPTPFPMANPIPTMNPLQMWWPFINSWIEFWSKAGTTQDLPTAARNLEKLWTDQIESWASAYGHVADTAPFADALGQYMSRVLTWGQRTQDAMAPQVDATLREANLPSRKQIDRLLERVIGLEDRLDDVEAQNQQILRVLKDLAGKAEPAARPSRRRRRA
jgi:hypothetical protein